MSGIDTNALVASIMESVSAQVADAVAAALPGAPGNEQKPATTPRKRKSSTQVGKRTSQPRKPKRTVACITAGDAWIALGSDPQYKPNDMDRPAANKLLWILNDRGMLTLNS